MNSPKFIAKIESEEPTRRLAVLIDADNAQASIIKGLLAEIARFGEAVVKRVYGDFTSSHSASWKKTLQDNAIKPVQQFAYTSGKNATDSTLIIDAMDLLYTGRFDGFCLISSDSDFTGLAMRLKEEGLMVYGFGEKKTPQAFRNACHKFILTENLRTENDIPTSSKSTNLSNEPSGNENAQNLKHELPQKILLSALEASSDDEGWAELGTFGSYLTKLHPDFDARTYGFKKLSLLVKSSTDLFITEERLTNTNGSKAVYLRVKS